MPNPENLINNGFKEHPERINRTGANRKLYSQHIQDIKDKGYVAPIKAEYFDMIGLLLAMEENDLKEFAKDITRPYWIRLIVIDLNDKKSRQRMMADYRDWLFGKAEQKTDVTLTDKTINITLNLE
jgi:hypothetical protein